VAFCLILDYFDQLRHGFGQLTMFHATIGRIVLYEGTFLCGAIHSDDAKLYNEKGDLEFRGEVFMGKKVKGKEYHYNKTLRYEGDFRCEKPHGKDCILYDIHGNIDFQGEINYGEPKRPFNYEEWKKKKERERANEIFKMQKRLSLQAARAPYHQTQTFSSNHRMSEARRHHHVEQKRETAQQNKYMPSNNNLSRSHLCCIRVQTILVENE